MSGITWNTGSADLLREFIVKQDTRFQAAMRASLEPDAAPEPKRIPLLPKRSPRDVISISHGLSILLKPTSWQIIIEETCVAHQVSRSELTGGQRSQRIVVARHEAMYRMKTETTMSLPQIGRRLGGRDHTTVLHGVRTHTAKLTGTVYRRSSKAAAPVSEQAHG